MNTRGIGLGLHISKLICEQFGGSIICESEEGRGSNFTFHFSLKEMVNANEERSRNFNPNPVSRHYKKIKIQRLADTVPDFEEEEVVDQLNVRRILIVDDEPFIQDSIKILINES